MERALVIQTAFLGDAILGTALLEGIHADRPECRIDYLVRKGNEGLFAGHPFLNRVLTFDKSRKVAELWRLIATIRAARYDVVINAQRFASSGLITVLSDAQQTVGYDRNPFSMFFGRKVDHPMSNGHEVDRLLELHSSSSETGRVLPRIYPSSEDERIASSHIKSPFITVAPASVWFTKQWPEAKWAEFIRQVPEHYDVLLTGGPGDVTLCERIGANAGRRVTVVAGKLTLLQTAVLMSKATMNYANDSAPVHLASAMNAPICEVFCSTVPEFGFTPLSNEAHIVETEEKLSCRPCGIHGHRSCPEGHFRCADISPQRLSALLK
jgi:heptosyltransferase-2